MARGKKTGGRTKGTPNKKTQKVMDILSKLNCDPIEGLAHLAMNGDEETTRLAAYKELAQYCYPKRKAIEVTGDIDTKPDKIEVVIVRPDED